MRLLCDEMLASLARWLRAAGHDTALATPGEPDASLLDRCRLEGRTLISRDRRLVTEARKTIAALWLETDEPDAQARAVAEGLGVDWIAAPFTRCMVDNTPLRPATDAELALMPASSQALAGPFRTCPQCRRVFWPGSHVRRMERQLRVWADANSPSPL